MTVAAKPHTARPPARPQFDQRKYARLLARTVPSVIRNEAECRRVEAEIATLLRKGDDLTPEEDRLLDLLSALVERYEDETEEFPASPPHRMLQFLLEQNDLSPAEMIKVFGSSARLSEVLNGKRAINKTQAKALGECFKVSPDLFI